MSAMTNGKVIAVALLAVITAAAPAKANDYPTAEVADYVLGCMAANGNSRETLLFSQYEKAETALSLQAGGGVGGRVGLFKDPPELKAAIEQLHQAQAEANLQCFR
jgi:hypothetical protein